MRLPGTSNFNYGTPLPVTIVAYGRGYRAIDVTRALMPSRYDVPADPVEVAAGKTTAKFLRKIGLDPKVFCGRTVQVADRGGGANDSREVWLRCLQFAAMLDEPERSETAVRLSHQWTCPRTGKAFDQNDMNTVLAGLRFPPTCASFNDARPGICTRYPSWKRIQSPISLMEHKPIYTPERQQAIDTEIRKFREVYTSHTGGVPTPATAKAALAAVYVTLNDLKERDGELAEGVRTPPDEPSL